MPRVEFTIRSTSAMASAMSNSASSSFESATRASHNNFALQINHPLLARNPRFRAGAVIKSLLTTVCGGAMLMTAAAVLDPATLQASSIAQSRPAIARDAHQEFVRSLASLIAQSRHALAVNQRIEDRGSEIILWFEDTHDLGRINADELALMRHSPLFQTITIYTASKALGHRPSDFSREPAADGRQPMADAFTPDDIASPGFIDRWRAMSAVQAKVVATGISDLQVTPVEGNDQSRLSNLRLHLQWTGDSVDGFDQASALVEVGRTTPATSNAAFPSPQANRNAAPQSQQKQPQQQ